MLNNLLKIASAIPSLSIADCKFNSNKIVEKIKEANEQKVEIICFPELSISGYSCGDLFYNNLLIDEALNSLTYIAESTNKLNIISILGLPIRVDQYLFDCAAVIYKGEILSIHPKSYPTNAEKRWFTKPSDTNITSVNINNKNIPFGTNLIVKCNNIKFAIEIHDDLFAPISPSTLHSCNGAQLIFNLSAFNEISGNYNKLVESIKSQSTKMACAYVCTSAGFGESTTDTIFPGFAMIVENGSIICKNIRFSIDSQTIISDIDIDILNAERLKKNNFSCNLSPQYNIIECPWEDNKFDKLDRIIAANPFVNNTITNEDYCSEILSIQSLALAKRMMHTNVKSLLVGVSGGLDSTLTLLVCADACDRLNIDRSNIIAITMPGFGTSNRTYENAIELIKSLKCTFKEISIKNACTQHFQDINHNINNHDVTYENAQARERTQILMDISNQYNGMVIGTGDLSELALGWATYNGDHMSMYGVNGGIPKTIIRKIVAYKANTLGGSIGQILRDIVDTPVSPELLPTNTEGTIAQKTEDLVGPYELHDFFIYYTLKYNLSPAKIVFLANQALGDKYDTKTINYWYDTFARRFFSQQFKRNCMPDGPKVFDFSLSPRGDWNMPSDASSQMWKIK